MVLYKKKENNKDKGYILRLFGGIPFLLINSKAQ